MKLYAPEYYKQFACIADKCRHSCCVGWEIDIDADTMRKYNALDNAYGADIQNSIEEGDTPHFRLCAGERCPHLDDDGLCKIINECGEEYLCDICRENPRFYNESPLGKEVGLGIACEEACRIVLASDGYKSIVEIGSLPCDGAYPEFNVLPLREKIYAILSDRSSAYTERLNTIYTEYGVSPSTLTDDEWRVTLASLEYLDEAHKELFSSYSSDVCTPAEIEDYLERALAYFIYRHCTGAQDESEFRAALGLSLLCERLLASTAKFAEKDYTGGVLELARIISEEIEYSEENTESIKSEFYF